MITLEVKGASSYKYGSSKKYSNVASLNLFMSPANFKFLLHRRRKHNAITDVFFLKVILGYKNKVHWHAHNFIPSHKPVTRSHILTSSAHSNIFKNRKNVVHCSCTLPNHLSQSLASIMINCLNINALLS